MTARGGATAVLAGAGLLLAAWATMCSECGASEPPAPAAWEEPGDAPAPAPGAPDATTGPREAAAPTPETDR